MRIQERIPPRDQVRAVIPVLSLLLLVPVRILTGAPLCRETIGEIVHPFANCLKQGVGTSVIVEIPYAGDTGHVPLILVGRASFFPQRWRNLGRMTAPLPSQSALWKEWLNT